MVNFNNLFTSNIVEINYNDPVKEDVCILLNGNLGGNIFTDINLSGALKANLNLAINPSSSVKNFLLKAKIYYCKNLTKSHATKYWLKANKFITIHAQGNIEKYNVNILGAATILGKKFSSINVNVKGTTFDMHIKSALQALQGTINLQGKLGIFQGIYFTANSVAHHLNLKSNGLNAILSYKTHLFCYFHNNFDIAALHNTSINLSIPHLKQHFTLPTTLIIAMSNVSFEFCLLHVQPPTLCSLSPWLPFCPSCFLMTHDKLSIF